MDRSTTRTNNFDFLRLVAALAVLVSHAFALTGRAQPAVGSHELGTIGVWVFFGISGYLIAQSWTLDPTLWRFLAKRALRIFPALVTALLLTVLVIGPLFTTLRPGEYFADVRTWSYLLEGAALRTPTELPGLFAANPYPRQVNGSLWTLAPEAWAYLAVSAVGLAGGLRRRWVAPAIAALLVVAPHDPTGLIPWPREIWLLQAFAVGASLYVLRDRVPWHGGIALALVAAFALAPSPVQLKLAVVAIPYAAVWVGEHGPAALRRMTPRGDYSYGIYLYAWPVGQATAAAWDGVGVAALIGVSLFVAWLLAIASWHVVERPALNLKRALGARPAPRAVIVAERAHLAPADPA